MGWIAFAEAAPPATEPRVKIEELKRGQTFSINTQARKFQLASIDVPAGRILARTVNEDGTYGPDAVLDYGVHKAAQVIVWADLVADEEVTRPLQMFEQVQSSKDPIHGVIIDLNKSKFPDCDIIVVWEKPYKGEMITECHPDEVKGSGQCMDGQASWMGRTLAEIRAMVLDLRKEHEQGYEDKTRSIIQEQMGQQQAAIQAMNDVQKQEIGRVVQAAAEQQSLLLKSIKDSCVMHVSGGPHNYEVDRMGDRLTNYLDDLYRAASQLTPDPVVANQAASELAGIITDAALKDYFLTRFAYVRQSQGRWHVFSEKGKDLGHYATKEKAVRRLRLAESSMRRNGSFNPEEIGSLEEVTT
jgi:hypothetical protein